MLNKLVKLLSDFKAPVTLNGEWLCDYNIPTQQIRKELAEYLIANGVTIDVVHCGDCKYYDEIRGLCECCLSEEHLDEDDYCDYGVRLDSMQATSEENKRLIDAERLKRILVRFEQHLLEFSRVEAAEAVRCIIKGLR